MLSRFIYTILFSTLLLSCSNRTSVVDKYQRYVTELEALLSEKFFYNKAVGKRYELSQLLSTSDPLYKKLYEANIINQQSYVIYSNPNCITLVTRINDNEFLHQFRDVLITNGGGFGQFGCGIQDNYSLNQDEYVIRLTTYSEMLGSLTITIAEN